MANIVDSIITDLKADNAVRALVSDRVYWLKPPGEAPYATPFLTVIEASDSPADYEDDTESESLVHVQVEIFNKGGFENIKNAVNKAMVNSKFERQPSGADDYIPELRLYHKTLVFSKQIRL